MPHVTDPTRSSIYAAVQWAGTLFQEGDASPTVSLTSMLKGQL